MTTETPVRPTARTPGVLTYVLLAAVVLIAAAVYLKTLGGGFILDDYDVVVNQEKIRHPSDAFWFFSHVDIVDPAAIPSGATWRNPYYRPFFFLTFVADYAIYGDRPGGYHATNVLLHMAVTCLLFLLARNFSGSDAAAFAASAVFAVHPAHAEAVTWITARNHLLGGLFLLAMVHGYRIYLDRKQAALLAFSSFCFALGLLSTEIAVMGIVMVAAYGMLLRRESFRPLHMVPYLVILAGYFLARVAVMGAAITSVRTMTQTERLLTAPYILVRYLRDALVPVNIPVAYQLVPVALPSDARFLWALAVLAGVCVPLALVLYRKSRSALFGAAWFFVCIFPMLNIVQEVQPFLMASRYLYIPSLGIMLAAAAGFAAVPRSARGAVMALAVIIAASLGVTALRQSAYYLDDVQLKTLILPRDERHQVMLAGVCLNEGKFARALMIGQEILRRDPFSTEGFLIVGDASQGMGQEGRAEAAYTSAVRQGREVPSKEHAYHALGVLYGKQGKYRESAEMLRQAIAIKPSAEAYENLGLTYENLGMLQEAEQSHADAARLRANPPGQ